MYAPMPSAGSYGMPVDPAAARRYALRRTVNRSAGLILAYQTIIMAASMVFGLIIGVVASVAMIARSGATGATGDGGLMTDAQMASDIMLRWTGMLSLASVLVGFLFMLLMRHRMILTRAFWTGVPGEHADMRPAWFLTFLALVIGVQSVLILAQLIFAALGIPLVSPTSDSLDESAVTVSMWLYIGLIGPVVEEVVFRGVLMRQLRPFGRNFAIVTSALMFALFHDDVVQGVFAFLCGLVFGFVAMEYSLVWSIALHVVNNAVISGVLSEFAASFGPTGDAAYAFLLMIVGIGGLIAVWMNHGWGLREYARINRSEPGTYRSWTTGWFLAFVIINGVVTLVSFASAMIG
ncbi:CPBP family intramembrane glutamic endopeptidase [Bifidobacterium samirii]|nr:type II CAAX endopeptidase family protein [Bifidobacterium samirii]